MKKKFGAQQNLEKHMVTELKKRYKLEVLYRVS